MSRNRHYLLACADGLEWSDLSPFVRSARQHAPDARLILFGARLSDSTLLAIRENGVELHPLDALFPEAHRRRTALVRSALWRVTSFLSTRLRYGGFGPRLLLRGGGLLLPRNQARFFHYLAFLENCSAPGDRFLFCDARDLVFQADPFVSMPADGILLTQEEAHVSIAENHYNARWYRETYGEKLLRLDGRNPVVCAGLFGGEREALRDLLACFVAESCRRPHLYGADQAILNHLHASGAIAARICPNRGALAWHLFGVAPDAIRISTDGTLTDDTGHRYPVVHMYDRHPHALAAVRKLWPPS